MQRTRFSLAAAVALAFSTTLFAQTSSPGYHSVTCYKLKPDSSAAFNKFESEEVHKIAQARVDAGELTGWFLLRAALPLGESVDCDFLIVSLYPKTPHQFAGEVLANAIRKSGLNITPDDYIRHREAVLKLMSVAVFQNQAAVGTPKKGDYFQINYMKVADANFDDWIAYEKKVWQPMAEALVKDGKEDAWSLNVQVMPFGSDLPYQAVTVDVFPSEDAVFTEDPQFADRFHKVHPDMEFGTTMEHFDKLRTRGLVNLYSLDDIVTAP
jgi:hypothetical protein